MEGVKRNLSNSVPVCRQPLTRTVGPRDTGAMTSFVSHTTGAAHNAYELSEWWKRVLAYVDLDGDPNGPGHEECMIQRADCGHQILFIETPDEKTAKNRLHFDLRPSDGTRDDEVRRVLELGATQLADLRKLDGSGWVVLADPEGNEFCILRSEPEIAAQRDPSAGL